MGILENVYVQNLERIYYTFSATGDVLVYEEQPHRPPVNKNNKTEEEVIVISGLAKHVFLEMDGRRTLVDVIGQAMKKAELSPEFEDEFRRDAIDFTKKLAVSKLIVKRSGAVKVLT